MYVSKISIKNYLFNNRWVYHKVSVSPQNEKLNPPGMGGFLRRIKRYMIEAL